jgi:hypothetical protein
VSVLYRVENPKTMQGLWYDRHASYNGFIRQLGDALCHDVPMGFDPQFLTDGHWFSACDNLADMSNWFSLSDLKRLHSIGYDLYRIEVPIYRTINGHAAFLRENVSLIEPAPMSLINEGWTANDR